MIAQIDTYALANGLVRGHVPGQQHLLTIGSILPWPGHTGLSKLKPLLFGRSGRSWTCAVYGSGQPVSGQPRKQTGTVYYWLHFQGRLGPAGDQPPPLQSIQAEDRDGMLAGSRPSVRTIGTRDLPLGPYWADCQRGVIADSTCPGFC